MSKIKAVGKFVLNIFSYLPAAPPPEYEAHSWSPSPPRKGLGTPISLEPVNRTLNLSREEIESNSEFEKKQANYKAAEVIAREIAKDMMLFKPRRLLNEKQIIKICIKELEKTAEAIKGDKQHIMLYSTLTISIKVLKDINK